MTPEQILARLVKPPLRCAECDCKRGGTGCTWIKSGDELTHEEYIGAALDLGPVVALVEAASEFYRSCNSAWAAGEPPHKVRDMLDAAETLDAALATFTNPGAPEKQEQTE